MTKEQDMQKTIDVLKKEGEVMGREIISLKRQIGGYKAANDRYRKDLEKCKKEAQEEVSRLHAELNKEKAYGKEADELNEQKAQRIDTLGKALDDMTEQRGVAIKDVEKVNELNAELSKKLADKDDALSTAREQIATVSQNNKDLSDEICALQAQIDWYNNLPWYKKIFVKTI